MRKEYKKNMLKANQNLEKNFIQYKQTLKEEFEPQPQPEYDYEAKPIGREGIQKRIAHLAKRKNTLEQQRKQITAEIAKLNAEIKKWEIEISPDQLTMF
jgi:hypothetical protein